MPHDRISLHGQITHIFAHRFVVRTAKGDCLADLTPHGAEMVKLRIGADVELEGERKPSEIKVTRFICGSENVTIEHNKKPGHAEHEFSDPGIAIEAVRTAGFEPIGKPRRKPKHFEIDGRRDGQSYELHVELNGRIRRARPVDGGPRAI